MQSFLHHDQQDDKIYDLVGFVFCDSEIWNFLEAPLVPQLTTSDSNSLKKSI